GSAVAIPIYPKVCLACLRVFHSLCSTTMNSQTTILATASVMFLLRTVALAADTPQEILLWPNGAPGSEGKTNAELVRIEQPSGDHVVTSVNKPSITPYLPAADRANGAAVVVAPGGGHREIWIDHEGHNVARWLSDHGVAAFVLKYRLARATN